MIYNELCFLFDHVQSDFEVEKIMIKNNIIKYVMAYRQSIEKSCNDFIAEVTPYLAQACKLPEKQIISDFYFDKRTHEVKGMIQIPEPVTESAIDQLYYYGKAAWRNQKS